MSRRRSSQHAYDVRIRIICTDNGTHDPYRIGTIKWYSKDRRGPIDLPGKLQVSVTGESRDYRPRRMDPVAARAHGFQHTYTFVCPVCDRNVPAERRKWQPRLLELEELRITELDVSRWHL